MNQSVIAPEPATHKDAAGGAVGPISLRTCVYSRYAGSRTEAQTGFWLLARVLARGNSGTWTVQAAGQGGEVMQRLSLSLACIRWIDGEDGANEIDDFWDFGDFSPQRDRGSKPNNHAVR